MDEIRSFLASIVECSDDAIIGLLPDGRIASWNEGARRVYGYSAAQVRGRPIALLSLPERVDEAPQLLQRIGRGERIRHFDTLHLRRDGQVVSVSLSLSPIHDAAGRLIGASLIARDMTGRIRTEEALREAEEKYRLLFSAESDAVILFDAESLEVIDFNAAALELYGYDAAEFARLSLPDLCRDTEPVRERLRADPTGRISRLPQSRHLRKDGTSFTADFSASTFLWRGERMLVGIIRDVTERLRSERMQRSLAMAQEIQEHLLPAAAPKTEGFDIHAGSLYCEETGGDYFDYFPLRGDIQKRIGFAVGDVTGHGIATALIMAMTKGMLQVEAERRGADLEGLFATLNRLLLRHTGSDTFLTLFCGVIDPGSGELVWNSAGHGPVLWLRSRHRDLRELATTGIPLGILEEASHRPLGPVRLEKGDVLLVGTDGLWEATDAQGETFGVGRMRQLLATLAERSAREIYGAVIGRVSAFCGRERPQDDMTLMVVKRTG